MSFAALLPVLLQAGGTIASTKAKLDRAEMFEESAAATIRATNFNVQNYTKQVSARLGAARAQRAGTGVELTTGSPLMVDDATITEIITQTAKIKEQGAKRARALEKQASQQRTGAFASLLSGGSQMFGPGGISV